MHPLTVEQRLALSKVSDAESLAKLGRQCHFPDYKKNGARHVFEKPARNHALRVQIGPERVLVQAILLRDRSGPVGELETQYLRRDFEDAWMGMKDLLTLIVREALSGEEEESSPQPRGYA